jgi:putative ABC transport system substrate-binding protein
MRTVAVLISDSEEYEQRLAAFRKGLRELGWTEGSNLRLKIVLSPPAREEMRKHAAELIAGSPDVIMTSGTSTLAVLAQATKTIPIVVTSMADPLGAGFVESLKRPGGNITGFMLFDYTLSGKWLQLLKEISPGLTRAAVVRDSEGPSGIGNFAVIQSVAPSVGMEVVPVNVEKDDELTRALEAAAGRGDTGLIVGSGAKVLGHLEQIVGLSRKLRLAAVYARRIWVDEGGLISYGPNVIELSERGASYVDRILKGERAAELPVQAPTRYELVINLKTAQAIGLTVPPALLARADHLIE